MKRIYIAGKITGNPNYMQEFKKAEDDLKAAGYAPVNPAAATAQLVRSGGNFTHEEYMDITYTILKDCEGIYLLRNWRESKGAREELCTVLDFVYQDFEILLEGELPKRQDKINQTAVGEGATDG